MTVTRCEGLPRRSCAPSRWDRRCGQPPNSSPPPRKRSPRTSMQVLPSGAVIAMSTMSSSSLPPRRCTSTRPRGSARSASNRTLATAAGTISRGLELVQQSGDVNGGVEQRDRRGFGQLNRRRANRRPPTGRSAIDHPNGRPSLPHARHNEVTDSSTNSVFQVLAIRRCLLRRLISLLPHGYRSLRVSDSGADVPDPMPGGTVGRGTRRHGDRISSSATTWMTRGSSTTIGYSNRMSDSIDASTFGCCRRKRLQENRYRNYFHAVVLVGTRIGLGGGRKPRLPQLRGRRGADRDVLDRAGCRAWAQIRRPLRILRRLIQCCV